MNKFICSENTDQQPSMVKNLEIYLINHNRHLIFCQDHYFLILWTMQTLVVDVTTGKKIYHRDKPCIHNVYIGFEEDFLLYMKFKVNNIHRNHVEVFS